MMKVNSLAPGRSDNNFGSKIFKVIPQNISLGTCCEIALRWQPQNLSNVKSTLVQVMAWCHQATSHYLNQCCPRSLTSYGVTRPRVKAVIQETFNVVRVKTVIQERVNFIWAATINVYIYRLCIQSEPHIFCTNACLLEGRCIENNAPVLYQVYLHIYPH